MQLCCICILNCLIVNLLMLIYKYSKTCLKPSLTKRPNIDFQDRLSLNTGQKYCRMLQESIQQYFRPSLSYHLSLRPLFCLFMGGRLRQVLLYLCTFNLDNATSILVGCKPLFIHLSYRPCLPCFIVANGTPRATIDLLQNAFRNAFC